MGPMIEWEGVAPPTLPNIVFLCIFKSPLALIYPLTLTSLEAIRFCTSISVNELVPALELIAFVADILPVKVCWLVINFPKNVSEVIAALPYTCKG